MGSKVINIGGVSGNFSVGMETERICGMEDIETLFFNNVFDSSNDIVARNEFVYNQFEYFLQSNRTDVLAKILSNRALLDAHGSIIKTMVILSTGIPSLENQLRRLDLHLINKYGH